MMSRGHRSGCMLLMLALLFRLCATGAEIPIRDGGINPANLGKGDWIYFLNAATNKLGGAAPGVVNLPTLMSYYKAQGLQYIIIKAGTGSTNFNGGGSGPQFNSNLVHHAHAAGLLIFAYTRSYDDDIQGEIDMAARCFALGADGWVIDAESEWESGATQAGPNGPARAIQYGEGLRALFPTKFIAHAPFPIISFHSSFPYREFGFYCDAVMPQAYWKSIYGNDPAAVQRMVTNMDNEYRNWQNSLSGIWTNAIKPIIPIGQTYNPATNEITTAIEVDEFFDRLRTNTNPASITGYKGTSFWRTDTRTADMWTTIATNTLGDTPGVPQLTLQPQSRNLPRGTNTTFTAWGTGSKPFHYRWRFNGTNLPSATSPNLVLTNLQLAQAGQYSVVVSNISGVTTSAVAILNISEPPTLFDVSTVAGATHAIVSWTSTNPSSSQVQFGLTPSYESSTSEDVTPVLQHSMLLAGLLPNTTYSFAVLSRVGTNLHRSAGWSFSTAGEVIMDNNEATYTGGWIAATSSADKYGADYRYVSTANGGGNGSALYYPNIATPGYYDVFVWYPQGTNRSTNTPITVYFNGGSVTTRINQETVGGGWRQVGTNLNFRSGTNGFVRVSNGTGESNQIVVADAVRFTYRTEQDLPTGPTAPDWWTRYYLGAGANTQLDPDGDGVPSWAEYLAGSVPTNAYSHLGFWSESAGPSALFIYFSPYLAGRTYQLESNNGNTPWTALSDAPAPAGVANGAGRFTITNSPGSIRLYRLKVSWSP